VSPLVGVLVIVGLALLAGLVRRESTRKPRGGVIRSGDLYQARETLTGGEP
jgi:hypothetical protein